jgi:hypothetical protein
MNVLAPVMTGPVPAIHAIGESQVAWMPGTEPAPDGIRGPGMTTGGTLT